MLTEKIRADCGTNKSSGLSPIDREKLLAATAAAKQRMLLLDRDSWPVCERDHGPVHIRDIINEWLAMRGLPMPSREADQHDYRLHRQTKMELLFY